MGTGDVVRAALVPCASSNYERLLWLQKVPSLTTILEPDDLSPPPDYVKSDMESNLDSIDTFTLMIELVTCV